MSWQCENLCNIYSLMYLQINVFIKRLRWSLCGRTACLRGRTFHECLRFHFVTFDGMEVQRSTVGASVATYYHFEGYYPNKDELLFPIPISTLKENSPYCVVINFSLDYVSSAVTLKRNGCALSLRFDSRLQVLPNCCLKRFNFHLGYDLRFLSPNTS